MTTRTPETDNAAARLALFRASTRIGPDAIAKRLGVSRAALYRFERGEIVKVSTVKAVADVLGLTFAETVAPLSDAEIAGALSAETHTARVSAHDTLTWFGMLGVAARVAEAG